MTFQGAGHEYIVLGGTVSGSEVKLLSAQNCTFSLPADLSGDVIVYSLHKQAGLADILGKLMFCGDKAG